MLLINEFDDLNVTLDYSNQFTIAKFPKDFENAEDFASEAVYRLIPYLDEKAVIVAISKNSKVVVLSNSSKYRKWLQRHFHKPSIGIAQFFDDVEPELIIEKLKEFYK